MAEFLPPLLARHERSIGILRERTEEKDGTIFFDITDQDLEGYNKFIPYYLHPAIDLQRRSQQEQFSSQSLRGLEPLGGQTAWSISPAFASAMVAADTRGVGAIVRRFAVTMQPQGFP